MALPLIGFFTGGLFAKVMGFVIASSIVRALTAFGVSIATFTGIDLVMTELTNFVNTQLGSVALFTTSILEMFGFTFMIQIILATAAGVLAIKAIYSAKKVVLK